MKKQFMSFLAMVAIALLPVCVQAQVTEATDAGVNLITPLTITETAALHFGSMSVSATPGTAVLSTQGVRTATGGVNLSALLPAHSTANYNVSGAANATYAITLPATITVSSGANNMTIGALLARTASAGADGLTGTLTAGGIDNFRVGGTLTVPANQPAGQYTGTFNVTVAYN